MLHLHVYAVYAITPYDFWKKLIWPFTQWRFQPQHKAAFVYRTIFRSSHHTEIVALR